MADWFFQSNGKQGPVNDDTASFLAQEGVIKAATSVWREGLTLWLRADSAPGFPYNFGLAFVPARTAAPPSGPEPPPFERERDEPPVREASAPALNEVGALTALEGRLTALEKRVPKSMILHHDFLTRAVAIWGHAIIPGLIFGAMAWVALFFLGFMMSSPR